MNNQQFSLPAIIQKEFQNPQNQLMKSSEMLQKLKNIEKSNELLENKEYEAYIRMEFTKDREFNARLRRLKIDVPWPVFGTPKKRVAPRDTVEEVTSLTQDCLISKSPTKTKHY